MSVSRVETPHISQSQGSQKKPRHSRWNSVRTASSMGVLKSPRASFSPHDIKAVNVTQVDPPSAPTPNKSNKGNSLLNYIFHSNTWAAKTIRSLIPAYLLKQGKEEETASIKQHKVASVSPSSRQAPIEYLPGNSIGIVYRYPKEYSINEAKRVEQNNLLKQLAAFRKEECEKSVRHNEALMFQMRANRAAA
ncbi:hypothetical protein DID80_03680 [Candidatus Marinamargulisbacteria bacterium SCGC AAA071-K20]|nr:hypothetical protein DID80_03680 [Candidatus Marinamargulisbacteria bacterium SCGC AAA071-K20]